MTLSRSPRRKTSDLPWYQVMMLVETVLVCVVVAAFTFHGETAVLSQRIAFDLKFGTEFRSTGTAIETVLIFGPAVDKNSLLPRLRGKEGRYWNFESPDPYLGVGAKYYGDKFWVGFFNEVLIAKVRRDFVGIKPKISSRYQRAGMSISAVFPERDKIPVSDSCECAGLHDTNIIHAAHEHKGGIARYAVFSHSQINGGLDSSNGEQRKGQDSLNNCGNRLKCRRIVLGSFRESCDPIAHISLIPFLSVFGSMFLGFGFIVRAVLFLFDRRGLLGALFMLVGIGLLPVGFYWFASSIIVPTAISCGHAKYISLVET
ncbi:MAG: hypothetical protein ABSC72_11700 [Methylovirgula sp.]